MIYNFYKSNYPGGTLLQKSFKIRSWVPSPQMPYFGGRPSPTPQRLEKIPPGFGLVGIIIRDRNNFSARDEGQQADSERRAVKEDELPAELEHQRDEARRRLSHLQQVADQRRAELQQRFADRAVHLAQRQLKNLR